MTSSRDVAGLLKEQGYPGTLKIHPGYCFLRQGEAGVAAASIIAKCEKNMLPIQSPNHIDRVVLDVTSLLYIYINAAHCTCA